MSTQSAKEIAVQGCPEPNGEEFGEALTQSAAKREKPLRFQRPFLLAGGLAVLVMLTLLIHLPLWGRWTPREVTPYFAPQLEAQGRIELNTADAAALCSLPGIGQSRAKDILAWRETNGPFETAEDLLQVPGIGEKTLEELREYIYIAEDN